LGGNAGFFEGVFVVDRNVLEDFSKQLWHTLGAVLIAVLATSLLLYPVIISLNRDVVRFSHEVLRGNLEIASVLGAAIAKRDSDTGDHNFRVTLYAIKLGEACGLEPVAMRQLILGAFLHDVGKIGITDNILLKPGKLTDEEFTIMRTHVALGVDIIADSEWLQGARQVIEHHHEKFDGKGYLHGLKGEEIPLNARIFAIVDVFDALTSRRPYKEPMALETALAIIKKDAGTHFDPRLVTRFLEIAPAIYASIGQAGENELGDKLRVQAMSYFLQASISGNKT
jgi:response regulator RpfG family c-di-GMP phosphodiesterase